MLQYFNWSGIQTKVFNAGSKRRTVEGAQESGKSDFFSSSNKSATDKRNEIALATLHDAIDWLTNEHGQIALFDATNTTKERRRLINDLITSSNKNITVICIESICTDESVLVNNLVQKVQHSPDFAHLSEVDAVIDLRLRIKAYEAVYEALDDSEGLAYIKVINLASKVICYQIFGALPLRCVQLLMSCHVESRPVYLVRAGHCDGVDASLPVAKPIPAFVPASQVTVEETKQIVNISTGPYALPSLSPLSLSQPLNIKQTSVNDDSKMPQARTCNAHLSEAGIRFAVRVGKYLSLQQHPVVVPFTSTLPRAVETTNYFSSCLLMETQQWSALGVCM